MKKILIVEDDPSLRANILELLEAEGFEGIGAADGAEGLRAAVARHPDLVICDIMLPDIDGYAVLSALQQHPDLACVPFIFLSAKATLADIRTGMNLGADDYITKPFGRTELLRAIEARFRRRAAASVPPAGHVGSGGAGVVAKATTEAPFFDLSNAAMRLAYEQAFRAAQAPINVLIVGETGVGKDVLANEIHRRSPRAAGPFVALNCAALPDTLVESELFGHEKDAFTGARARRAGHLEAAHGGTVFLDEIGDLPISVQIKLLRVIDERKVTPVGARTPIAIDVRFIAATNRDIESEAERGLFRQDLFFRLNGIMLTLPPLRDRVSEIAPLAQGFIENARRTLGMARSPRLTPDALAALEGYAWPGNVRQLRNVIDRAVVLCGSDEIGMAHLPAGLTARPSSPPPVVGAPRFSRHDGDERTSADALEQLRGEMQALDRERIIRALEQHSGNQTRAAKALGVSRRTLVSRLHTFDLPRPRKRP